MDIRQEGDGESGVEQILPDGEPHETNLLPYSEDVEEQHVEVTLA